MTETGFKSDGPCGMGSLTAKLSLGQRRQLPNYSTTGCAWQNTFCTGNISKSTASTFLILSMRTCFLEIGGAEALKGSQARPPSCLSPQTMEWMSYSVRDFPPRVLQESGFQLMWVGDCCLSWEYRSMSNLGTHRGPKER